MNLSRCPRVHPFARSHDALAGVAVAALALAPAQASQIDSTPRPIFPELQVAGVLDYDGDGLLEIIGTEARTGQLEAHRTDGAGRPVFVRAVAAAGIELTSVVSADMDGDGTQDLVGIGGEDPTGTIVVFYDRGGELFEPYVSIGSIDRTNQLVATDFDADGATDLLVYPASERLDDLQVAADAISLMRNLGGGNFDAPVWVMSFPESLRNAAPLDVDLDGDTDFVAVRPAFGTLVVARDTGSVFEVLGVPSSETNIRDLATGDVNGDGTADVVTLRTAEPMGGLATVELYLGVLGGTFSAPTVVLAGESDAAMDVSLLDVDGDGALDVALSILVGELGQPALKVLAGNGVGGFAAPTSTPVDPGTQLRRSLTGDVSGDGRDDILQRIERVGPFFESIVSTFAFLGGVGVNGPLSAREFLVATSTDSPFAAGDLNGDGVIDLVTRKGSGVVALLGMAGSDYFHSPKVISAAPNRFVPMTMADLNQDGREDVIGSWPSQTGIETLGVLLTSANVVGSAFFPLGDYSSSNHLSLVVDDWDSDGDLDVIVNGGGNFSLTWHENQGGGAFSGNTTIDLNGSAFDSWSDLVVSDFNGDGELDLAVAVASSFPISASHIEWYEGLGSGTFGPRQVLSSSNGPIASADLNADGLADLFFVDAESGPTTVIGAILGSPSGLVAQSAMTLVVDSVDADQLVLESVDGDNSLDLVLLTDDGSSFAYLAGAAGAFDQNPTLLADPGTNNALSTLVDVGGDGDVDILIGIPLGGILWHENSSLSSAGTSYCGPAATNSIGASGRMLALGSTAAALNNIQLHAVDLPPLVFGFFIVSQTATPATPAAGSSGLICVGGQVGRFVGPGEVKNTGFYGDLETPGAMSLRIDLTNIPTPLGSVSVTPGSTWNFQAWHRDTSAQGVSSNFTDAVSVTFP